MELEPWQAEMFVKIEEGYKKGSEQVLMMSRQSGKSEFYQLYKKFMEKPANRFVPYSLHHKAGLMIQDYMWWHANEREILNWMAEHLPRGIEHQQGMTVTFDTDQERLMFLLRWA